MVRRRERTTVAMTSLVAELPATVPFVAPEAIERKSGRPIRLRLGANESNFGPSPLALEAMREAILESANYGDPENYDLRAALAQVHGIQMDQIMVGSGIDDSIGFYVFDDAPAEEHGLAFGGSRLAARDYFQGLRPGG